MTSTKLKHRKSNALGYVFGGLSFIPLVGVFFAVLAIVFGIIRKAKGPIFLGIAGILCTVILYGGLFYWGYVAKTGPYVELKRQLTVQVLDQTKGQVLLYRENKGKLPKTIVEMEKESTSAQFTVDGYGNPLIYTLSDDGKSFELSSMGMDGIPYTEDDIHPSQ